MGGGSKVMCRECGREPAKVRCANCGYAICNTPNGGCAAKLGGGGFRMPKCPMCDSRKWKAP